MKEVDLKKLSTVLRRFPVFYCNRTPLEVHKHAVVSLGSQQKVLIWNFSIGMVTRIWSPLLYILYM